MYMYVNDKMRDKNNIQFKQPPPLRWMPQLEGTYWRHDAEILIENHFVVTHQTTIRAHTHMYTHPHVHVHTRMGV